MAILSKEIFYRNISEGTPCSILHLFSDKCTDGMKVLLLDVLIGAAKFFGPIYMLRLIVNWKKLSKTYVKSQFIAYLRSIMFALTFAGLFFGNLCILGNINRNYYTGMCAGFIGGLSYLVESKENKNINTLLFFNQVVEAAINFLTHKKYITKSRWNETLTFMFISSILMYLFKTTYVTPKFTHLWFYPTRSLLEDCSEKPQAPCYHRTPCSDYAKNGAVLYFLAGYGIEFMKTTLPAIGEVLTKPKHLLSRVFNRKNLLFGLFLGSYVYLYRSITCRLLRRNGEEFPIHASIAGFIAGITYYFRPNIQVPIIGITTIIQLLCRKVQKNYRFPDYIPYSVITFCILSGVLLHLRFHLDDYCPIYTRNMLNMVTNNFVQKTYNSLLSLFNESDKLLLGV